MVVLSTTAGPLGQFIQRMLIGKEVYEARVPAAHL